jgi:hypothetical protein
VLAGLGMQRGFERPLVDGDGRKRIVSVARAAVKTRKGMHPDWSRGAQDRRYTKTRCRSRNKFTFLADGFARHLDFYQQNS